MLGFVASRWDSALSESKWKGDGVKKSWNENWEGGNIWDVDTTI